MMRWISTAVLVVAALGLGYYAGHRAPAAPAPIAPPAGAPAQPADPNVVQAAQAFNPDFVKLAQPVQQTVPRLIPVTGKLSLDKQQVRLASARVAGRLGRIFVFEGQSVKAGETLAEIYSPDYISAEQEFLLAKRFKDTLSQDAADGELREDTNATYQSAANKLKVLGATDADIAVLAGDGKVDQYLKVRAPISGVVTQRNVDPGGYLNIGDTLMTVANTDTLWLYFNTYDVDYAALKLGQELSFQTSSLPQESFTGHVAFIAASIDPASHTLPVRCDIPNAGMRLRPEMFVSGQLKTGEQSAWVVPRSAVFRIREQDHLFVQDGDKHYLRTAVKGHALGPDQYAVTEGLGAGPGAGLTAPLPVVIDGAVLLNQINGQN